MDLNLIEKTIWAELKFKVLKSALMINDGYTNDEVISHLMEVVELLENTNPQGSENE